MEKRFNVKKDQVKTDYTKKGLKILFLIFFCFMNANLLATDVNSANYDSMSLENGNNKTFKSGSIDEEAADLDWEENYLTYLKSRPAPNFTVKDIYGKTITLKNITGNWAFLYFWSSLSPWSIDGFRHITDFYVSSNEKPTIICFNCYDSKVDWERKLEDLNLPSSWIQSHCKIKSKVLNDYVIRGFPTLIIITPDGFIVYNQLGYDIVWEWEYDKFLEHINRFLKY